MYEIKVKTNAAEQENYGLHKSIRVYGKNLTIINASKLSEQKMLQFWRVMLKR